MFLNTQNNINQYFSFFLKNCQKNPKWRTTAILFLSKLYWKFT